MFSHFYQQKKDSLLYPKKTKRKQILFNHIKYLSSNGISVRDYLDGNPFPEKPFELRDSEEIFGLCKI